jgi:ribonuclease BN (tRNA processing enzyme)
MLIPSRRLFMLGASAASVAASMPAFAQTPAPGAAKPRMRLILLGTRGGPGISPRRHAPAQVIVIDDVPYLVDCGNGTAYQYVAAGLRLNQLRYIFVTHHHSDHVADYGNMMLLAWAAGLKTPIDSYGPPPLEKMTRLYFEMNAVDIDTRIDDEGRPDLRKLVHAHEITGDGGPVMQDERVKVTSARVPHPEIKDAFAYRFDGPDRSIVISGDTAPSYAVVALAKGADVLVHEVLHGERVRNTPPPTSNAATILKHVLAAHTSNEVVGEIAAKAGVKKLVLSHFVPDDPSITDEMWLAPIRKQFSGEIVLGKDLMEI